MSILSIAKLSLPVTKMAIQQNSAKDHKFLIFFTSYLQVKPIFTHVMCLTRLHLSNIHAEFGWDRTYRPGENVKTAEFGWDRTFRPGAKNVKN